MVSVNDDQIRKALVSLAIEQTLREISLETLHEVGKRIFENYNCYIPDCYEHPEYLSSVLKDIFGNSYNVIVESIKKQLGEFALQKPIEEFLVKIER
ncbi:MAG: hypothetical protein ACREAF_04260 [Nitrosopumilaceae archaeon]